MVGELKMILGRIDALYIHLFIFNFLFLDHLVCLDGQQRALTGRGRSRRCLPIRRQLRLAPEQNTLLVSLIGH